ncbi:LysR family transcriptional regulator [Streptomyces flavofungini]|uniref:LysR family transcriptional regulator n=1 Tax=Streptomyces flavofungini TaxID=68200 RepID=A0ABS0XH04_9ACTN|nr:LysR family transcriptional regulator [Streptomyces flavofungini]MBJ3812499.1 LysR family transcriptional regulator [Streptomyces flavofungini]
MDLDMAQVRAFVYAAQELHFGRAAGKLAITQQALSKRIGRLESLLGTKLFDRPGHGVALTEAGRGFLEPARRVLAAADDAVAATVRKDRPLRVDVWGHLYAPMRTLAQVTGRGPGPEPGQAAVPAPELELGHGRDLPTALAALLHGDIDAAFGRVHPPLPADLTHRLVRLEPVDAVLSTDHPLAAEPALRPGQLRDSVLWAPGALDRLDFLRRFADRFDIRERAGSVNLGLPHFLTEVAQHPRRFSLLPADVPLPDVPGLRSVPLVDPTPLYAWSLLWRTGNTHPGLSALAATCAGEAGRSRWLEYDPARDWLPEKA